MTGPQNKVVAREAVQVKGDLREGPNIGSGAWIFKEWVPNSTLKFTRNHDYFRAGLPYADSLELPRIADESTAIAAFRTKQTLFVSGNTQLLDDLKRSNPELVVTETARPGPPVTTLVLRANSQPTNDIRVRQAI